MQIIEDIQTIDAGTSDWIQSIQRRFGEAKGAMIAKSLQSSDDTFSYHMFKVSLLCKKLVGTFSLKRKSAIAPRNDFDEVETRTRLINLMKNIQPFWQYEGMPADNLIISTLPSLSLCAFCVQEPGADKNFHIFYDEELGTFSYMISKLMSEIMNISDDGRITVIKSEELQDKLNGEFGLAAFDLFFQTCRTGSARHSKPRVPVDAIKMNFFLPIANAIEVFILGHELGHICLGHFKNPDANIMYQGMDDLHAMSFAHDLEFKADEAGVMLCHLYTRKEFNSNIGIIAVSIFMRSLETLAQCDTLFSKPSGILSTHPNPLTRIQNLITYAQAIPNFGLQIEGLQEMFFQTMERMAEIENWLLKKIEEEVRKGAQIQTREPLIPKIQRPAILG
jgi:hypothetical protein